MSAIMVLIGLSIVIASAFLITFLYVLRSGQYDDMYTPSVRMLFDHNRTDAQEDKNDVSTTIEDSI